ncbi:hypothetical protein [Aeromonas sobria]|nr:hypothetical protein [Aeromonas sobria]
MSGMIRCFRLTWSNFSRPNIVAVLLLSGCQSGESNINQASSQPESEIAKNVELEKLGGVSAIINIKSQSNPTTSTTATSKQRDFTSNRNSQILTPAKTEPVEPSPDDKEPLQVPSQPEPAKDTGTNNKPAAGLDTEPLQAPSQPVPAKDTGTNKLSATAGPNIAPQKSPLESEKSKSAGAHSKSAESIVDKNKLQVPPPITKKAVPASKMPLTPPSLPKIMPDIRAPNKYKHPLQHANKIIFMLGEDDAGHYLYGEGPLLAGAYEKMLRYVKFYQESGIELNRFMLHSPGGLVNEGLLIGNYIRKHNWTTDSDKYMRCYSSCGFIFASGVKKRIQQGAEIGFHRPYLPNKVDTPDFIKQVYTEYQPYWHYIQGNPALYEIFMKQYGREDMYILRADTISQYMQIEVY